MTNEAMSNSLPELVAALPEVYQPIFGYPKLSVAVSRGSEDRFEQIVNIYRALESQLNRPLRVLDLGCAQGFFSLGLAKLGALVNGVDSLESNIAVCQALAREHPEFKADFEIGRIEDVIARLVSGQYDLVLGLSVFHQIVYEVGIASVQLMLTELAGKVLVGIFELALSSEPLYWGPSQPQDPRFLLDGFVFVHELTRHGTHLSAICRPLYVSSNRYWCLDGQAGIFDTWQADSHAFTHGVHQGTRRYFFGGGYVIKLFRLDCVPLFLPNSQEHNNEKVFLLNPPPGFNAPQLLLQGKNEHEAWLVRKQLYGELLSEIICCGKQYDAKRVLQDVLAQLVALEAAGFYHSDVRGWNILISIDDGQANLIDYGAISKDKKDCIWPRDIFLAFFIFVYEVTTGLIEFSDPVRMVAISPYRLKQPYRNWLFAFWSTPMEQWSFKLMQRLFSQMNDLRDDAQFTESSSQYFWMNAIEEAVDAQVSFARHLQEQQLQIKKESENMAAKVVDAQAYVQRLQNELVAARVEIDKSSFFLHHCWTVYEQLSRELQCVYASKSWRITRPLRKIKRIFKLAKAFRKRVVC